MLVIEFHQDNLRAIILLAGADGALLLLAANANDSWRVLNQIPRFEVAG